MKYQYLSTVQQMEAIDNISNKVFVRLSYEYGICIIKRQLIPTLGSIFLKTVISNLNNIRENNDMSAYINIDDLLILGLVELNFEETEKATNILPDFRLGKKACEIMGISYEKYDKTQTPLNKFKGRILNKNNKKYWEDLLYIVRNSLYAITNIAIDQNELIDIFARIFLEEVFYEIKKHLKQKNYSFKLYDLIYFEMNNGMICLDSLPEYKLMVKNDSRLEDSILVNKEEEIEHHGSTLYF